MSTTTTFAWLLMLICFGSYSKTYSTFQVSSWMLDRYCLNNEKTNNCLDELRLYANPLVSQKEFNPESYENGFFCQVSKPEYVSQTLGEALTGDHPQPIPYNFKFNQNITCHDVCSVAVDSSEKLDSLINIISKMYTQRWYGDSVPVSYCHTSPTNVSRNERCNSYFMAGCGMKEETASSSGGGGSGSSEKNDEFSRWCIYDFAKAKKFVIFNHLIFNIIYKEVLVNSKTYAQVIYIDVDVTSASDKCQSIGNYETYSSDKSAIKLPMNINYSYSVNFIKDNKLSLTNRVDYLFYGHMNNLKRQWFNIILVFVIFVIFSVVLGLNFYNLLSKDILRYTQLIDNAQLDIQDEYGWKLLQGDVFRPPKFPLILATTVGFGVQLVAMVMTSLLFAAVGLLSTHTNRALMTCVVVFYILFGVLSGYVSSRLYKFFGGEHWKMCVFGTSVIHPGLLFMMIFGVNFWLIIYSSPSAVRSLVLVGLFFLWLLIQVPLTFLGSYVGFRHRVIQSPVKINHIPRFIPAQSITTHRLTCIILGGIPSFVCLYWQLYFLIQSVWVRLHFAMFGFLFAAALIAVIVCAEVAVLLGYLHMSSEDYRWQWRSFFTAASTSVYCFIVVIYYYMHSHVTGSLGAYAYFTYSLVVLYMLALALGSVGFLSCFFVFLKMYSSIKVD